MINNKYRRFFKLPGFWFILSMLVLLASCAQVPEEKEIAPFPRYRRPAGNPTPRSIDLFVMGEQAFAEGNFRFASILYQQADQFDRQNVSIKERLLESMLYLAEADSATYHKVIDLAGTYIENGLITPQIYRLAGQAKLHTGNTAEGLGLLGKALKLEPDPYQFYDFFIFTARYDNKLEFLYLEKALKLSWNDPQMVYAIARIYEYYSPIRSKEILEEAYRLYEQDEESLTTLLDFYLKFQDWRNLSVVVEKRFAESKPLPDKYKELYLQRLFAVDDYSRIAEIYPYYHTIKNEMAWRHLFYASFQSGHYERVLETGEKLLRINEDSFEKDEQDLIRIFIGQAHYYLNDHQNAFRYLAMTDNLLLLCGALRMFFEEGYDKTLEETVRNLTANGMTELSASLLLTFCLLNNDDFDNAKKHLYRALELDNGNDDLWQTTAIILLDKEMIKEAELALSKIRKDDFDPNLFIGEYYSYAGNDSLAAIYFKKSISTNPQPPANAFLSLASIYNKKKESTKEIELMKQALNYHRDEPLILNWLGYTLVIETDRYEEAEEYLLKAIELSPDSHHIQDSVAWLYYKMQDYHKALHYMQQIIEEGVTDTIVAYHIGMIYLKLEEPQLAKEYFTFAVEIANDEEYTLKAKEALLSLGETYE